MRASARRTASPAAKASVGSSAVGAEGRSSMLKYSPPTGLLHARPCLP